MEPAARRDLGARIEVTRSAMCGARTGLVETCITASPLRQEVPANGFQLVDSLRRSRRGGSGGRCVRSFGCGRASPFGLGGLRYSRSKRRAWRVRTFPAATLERVVREDRSFL